MFLYNANIFISIKKRAQDFQVLVMLFQWRQENCYPKLPFHNHSTAYQAYTCDTVITYSSFIPPTAPLSAMERRETYT